MVVQVADDDAVGEPKGKQAGHAGGQRRGRGPRRAADDAGDAGGGGGRHVGGRAAAR